MNEANTINELVKYMIERREEAFAKYQATYGHYGILDIEQTAFHEAFNAAIDLMIEKGQIQHQMTLKTATKLIEYSIENNGHSQR